MTTQNRSKPFRPRSPYTEIRSQPTEIDQNDRQNHSKPLKTVQTALSVHGDLPRTDLSELCVCVVFGSWTVTPDSSNGCGNPPTHTQTHTHKPSGKPVRLPFQRGCGWVGGMQAAPSLYLHRPKSTKMTAQNHSKPFRPRSTYSEICSQPTKMTLLERFSHVCCMYDKYDMTSIIVGSPRSGLCRSG